jgi:catechol 2,3-dioxygenase-like lactoylglutathione lyase family enzyme
MPVDCVDHVNIRTPDLPGTVAFFSEVLGMTPSDPPGANREEACWMLDAEGRAAVHLGRLELRYPTDHWQPRRDAAATDTGRLHHVALRCSDYDMVRARLVDRGCTISENAMDSIGLKQIFVIEPNNIMLELNFWNG